MEDKSIRDLVIEEAKNGNVIVNSGCGLEKYKLSEFVKQPAEGLLYDLNRDSLTILAFIDNPKWINDFACSQVIRYLKEQLDCLQKEHKDLLDKVKRKGVI